MRAKSVEIVGATWECGHRFRSSEKEAKLPSGQRRSVNGAEPSFQLRRAFETRRFHVGIQRLQDVRRLFLQHCNIVTPEPGGARLVAEGRRSAYIAARQPKWAHGRPRGRVPDLVGPRLPRPYHFPARIQSSQAVAAPFPGEGNILTPWPQIARGRQRDVGDRTISRDPTHRSPRRRTVASPFASRIRPLGLSLSRTYSNSSPPAHPRRDDIRDINTASVFQKRLF